MVAQDSFGEPALVRFLRACRRFAWVIVVGAVLTTGAVYLVGEQPGVYYSATRVRLQRPPVVYANPLTDTGDIVAATGVLQRIVGGRDAALVVSQDVTLADLGVREGQSVLIWNGGGQWNNWYNKPELRVEVCGPTEAEVRARMTNLLTTIDDNLVRLQERDGVEAAQFITTQRIPPNVSVILVGGKPSQARAVTLLLGIGLTACAVNVLDGRRSRRRAEPEPDLVDRPLAAAAAP